MASNHHTKEGKAMNTAPAASTATATATATGLSKAQRGRYKKLHKRALAIPKETTTANGNGGGFSGLTSFSEAEEYTQLKLKLQPQLELSSDGDIHGDIDGAKPSIHLKGGGSIKKDLTNVEHWKQTEGNDHRQFIESIVFQKDTKGNKGTHKSLSKKRKRSHETILQGHKCVSWATVHNPVLIKSIAVIEIDITGNDFTECKQILPSTRITSHVQNKNGCKMSSQTAPDADADADADSNHHHGQDTSSGSTTSSIFTQLVSPNGYKGKRCLPFHTRLFQGDQPKHLTDVLLYKSPKDKPPIVDTKHMVSSNGASGSTCSTQPYKETTLSWDSNESFQLMKPLTLDLSS